MTVDEGHAAAAAPIDGVERWVADSLFAVGLDLNSTRTLIDGDAGSGPSDASP